MKGKTVIVFGGSSGLGFASAKAIAKAGGHVILVSRSPEKLETAQKAIGKHSESYSLDVSSDEQVRAFFEKAPSFDHVVVTASSTAWGPFLEMEMDTAHHFFESKFWGAYRIAQFGASKINERGSFTFISGVAGQRPFPGLSCGGAINAALDSLVRSLALELAPLRFNTISPGPVDTPVWDTMAKEEKEALFQSLSERLPVGRVGTPNDIAAGVLFLIRDTFVTGTNLIIDGGHLQA